MPQAEEICDHIVMMHRGRKMIDDPIAAIRGQHDTGALLVEPLAPHTGAEVLQAIAGVAGLHDQDGVFELALANGADTAAVMQQIVRVLPVARVELKRPRLEDIFIRIVAGDSREEAAALRENLNAPEPAEAAS
jgi:ABC-type uncharacterized transport system ATPase subunit